MGRLPILPALPHAASFGPPNSAGELRVSTSGGDCGDTLPAGATALAINVTITQTENVGYLTVWPTGQPQPNASVINWTTSDTTVANAIIVPVGGGGAISIFSSGATYVILDVSGYFLSELETDDQLAIFANNSTGAGIFSFNNSGTGIEAQSFSGAGLFGVSDSGRGVHGQSESNYGVYGVSNTTAGVYGESNSFEGVRGFSTAGTGVRGQSTGGFGVEGQSNTGNGVSGLSSSGFGVFGRGGSSGAGVRGEGTGSSGMGVSGLSTGSSGIGARGESTGSFGAGVRGDSSLGFGVRGTSSSGIGVIGESMGSGTGVFGQSSSGLAGDFNVRVRVRSIPFLPSFASVCFNAAGELLQCGASSLRLKTDVRSFSGGLDIVRRLRPINFRWKENGIADVGLGAEEVAEVAPSFVFTNSKGEVEGVKYERLNMVLINAIKEQQQQFEQQQKEIRTLRAEVRRLRSVSRARR